MSPYSDSLSLRLAYAQPRQTPATRWPVMQKVRRHSSKITAPTACKRMVSGTISLPLRGTFHLSLTVLVRYRSPLVFSLAGWSPRIRSGFHVSGSTQVPTWESHDFRLRASNPLRTDIPDRSATRAFCNSQAALRDGQIGPTTPNTQRPQAFTHPVWAISPFARHYSGNRDFLYFPPGTQMCHFPGFPPPVLCVQTGVTRHYPCRVSPFGEAGGRGGGRGGGGGGGGRGGASASG